MNPRLRFLDDALVSRILDEAHDLLATLGVEVHNDAATELLLAHGARKDERGRVLHPRARSSTAPSRAAPRAVRLFDALGAQTHELGGDAVYFTPGSAAIHVLDGETGRIRTPTTADYVRYAKLVAGLPHIAVAVDRPHPGRRARRRSRTASGSSSRSSSARSRWSPAPSARRASRSCATCSSRCAGRRTALRGAAALRLLLLPDRAPQVELRDEPERDRLRARGHPGRVHLDAALRLRGPGDARGQRRAARGGDALRRRPQPARLGRAPPSSGAARPPSSTSATRRRRWAPSRR